MKGVVMMDKEDIDKARADYEKDYQKKLKELDVARIKAIKRQALQSVLDKMKKKSSEPPTMFANAPEYLQNQGYNQALDQVKAIINREMENL